MTFDLPIGAYAGLPPVNTARFTTHIPRIAYPHRRFAHYHARFALLHTRSTRHATSLPCTTTPAPPSRGYATAHILHYLPALIYHYTYRTLLHHTHHWFTHTPPRTATPSFRLRSPPHCPAPRSITSPTHTHYTCPPPVVRWRLRLRSPRFWSTTWIPGRLVTFVIRSLPFGFGFGFLFHRLRYRLPPRSATMMILHSYGLTFGDGVILRYRRKFGGYSHSVIPGDDVVVVVVVRPVFGDAGVDW